MSVLNQKAITIARQLTREQKCFLANFTDPVQRGNYKRSCANVNQAWLENKLKKGKKAADQQDFLTGGEE